VANITLTLLPEMDLTAGDTLTLALPSFTGQLLTSTLVSTPAGAFLSSSWNESASLLILAVSSPVPADTPVEIIVPIAAELSLPVEGIRTLNGLALSTDAALGPVPVTPIAVSPAVGALTKSSLVFPGSPSPGKAERAVLTFEVTPKPETWKSNPKTHNSKPETRNPKHGTRDPKPEAWNSNPEIRNSKSATRNQKPENRNPEQAVVPIAMGERLELALPLFSRSSTSLHPSPHPSKGYTQYF
jgi:hypothetical protein